MRVDQWLPAAHRGDAIGDEAIRIRDVLRRAGHASQIFALDIDEEAAAERSPLIVYLGVNPRFDSLRAEPRFIALLKKAGLNGGRPTRP